MTQALFYKVCIHNHSAYAWFNWQLEYKMNEFVYPKTNGSKLFVFDTLIHANKYADMLRKLGNSNLNVYACEVVNPEYPTFKVAALPGTFANFWKNKESVVSVRTCPQGTVICDAVQLIKKV